MWSTEELFAQMPRLEAELGALIVPTLGVPIAPNPLDHLFPSVQGAMDRHLDAIRHHASQVVPFIFARDLERIPEDKVDEVTPYWRNEYFHPGDARLAYAVVARYRPRLIGEIGCGNSTKFMRRAATDHGTGSRLVCIDPRPREDILGWRTSWCRPRCRGWTSPCSPVCGRATCSSSTAATW